MTAPRDAVAVEVDGLHKRYGDVVAVDDIGFTVGTGEILGILGPNGAGKTTTVECVAGLRVGDRGRVRVHGLDPWTQRAEAVHVLGVQLQQSALQPKITVREALELWTAFYRDPAPWRDLAERLGLTPHLGRRFAALSGGQQQRLSIALALIGRPRVAILDELSTGLDPRARRQVWALVRDLRSDGVTVLLVTHSMEEAHELCDRVAVIDGGRLRALDTPDALVRAGAAATVTSFETTVPPDLQRLRAIDGVTGVRTDGARVVVEGTEDVVLAVLAALAAEQLVPHRLRVGAGSLDIAYLGLTQHADESASEPIQEFA